MEPDDRSPRTSEHPGTADVDAIERDLADVERALDRLQSGTYWTDEVTGQPLEADHLATNPLTRRNPA